MILGPPDPPNIYISNEEIGTYLTDEVENVQNGL